MRTVVTLSNSGELLSRVAIACACFVPSPSAGPFGSADVIASAPLSCRYGARIAVYQPPPGTSSTTCMSGLIPKNASVSAGWRYLSRARSASVRAGFDSADASAGSIEAACDDSAALSVDDVLWHAATSMSTRAMRYIGGAYPHRASTYSRTHCDTCVYRHAARCERAFHNMIAAMVGAATAAAITTMSNQPRSSGPSNARIWINVTTASSVMIDASTFARPRRHRVLSTNSAVATATSKPTQPYCQILDGNHRALIGSASSAV